MHAVAKDRAAELTTRLLSVSAGLYNPVDMSEEDVDFVLDNIKTIIMKRPMLVEIKAPTHVLGDIHGQYFDLLRVFEVIGFPEKDNQMLFLGDYVDRGRFGLETVMLLFSFKIQYPDLVHLLRGNHESKAVSRVYGFYEECKQRFHNPKVWKRFMDVFDCLPVAAIINKAILCMHGGLSQQIKDYHDIKKIPRPSDIPQTGIMADLLWADPDPKLKTGWQENTRGVSFTFAADVVHEFCKKNDLDLIIRAHQVVYNGFETFADQKMLTLFTAPNFCGQFENRGGIASIDKDLKLSFHFIESFSQQHRHKGKGKKTGPGDTDETTQSTMVDGVANPAKVVKAEGMSAMSGMSMLSGRENVDNAKKDGAPSPKQGPRKPGRGPKQQTVRETPPHTEKKEDQSASGGKKPSSTRHGNKRTPLNLPQPQQPPPKS